VVLIAGGRDKGNDLTELARVAAQQADAAVLIGESGPTIERLINEAGLARTTRAATLDDAVAAADRLARARLDDRAPGTTATVLMSPAAASFDMFVDYAARGRAFKDEVKRLEARNG
jgi:UDP-N-acetylmuramoylalanine--D-glutamate ligase